MADLVVDALTLACLLVEKVVFPTGLADDFSVLEFRNQAVVYVFHALSFFRANDIVGVALLALVQIYFVFRAVGN